MLVGLEKILKTQTLEYGLGFCQIIIQSQSKNTESVSVSQKKLIGARRGSWLKVTITL